MLNVPNLLSLSRIPLALVFLQDNLFFRAAALILAMLSDCLDGYLARKHRLVTPLGTSLDPLMDKFFVFFVLGILFKEGRLCSWEAIAMLCRDFSVIIFGCYLAWKGTLRAYQVRAIWSGKVTTFMQFTVLLGLTCRMAFPPIVFISFIIIGLLALVELYLQRTKTKVEG
jgi:phosphatidylglycerophosphate synthase